MSGRTPASLAPSYDVVVVGAANLDIKGRTSSYLVPHTSNPGAIQVSSGGVGRNIAENLARLGVPTALITVFSDDEYGRIVAKATAAAGVHLEHALTESGLPTSLFMAIMNQRGDLEVAISDMAILCRITAETVRRREEVIAKAKFLVMDADLPLDTIQALLEMAARHRIKVCVEPVSVAKAVRIAPFVPHIHIITPNREETEALVGFPLRSSEDVQRAGRALVDQGVELAILTLGPEGLHMATAEEAHFLPSISTMVVDSVGAGDALVAGVVYGLLQGYAPVKAVGAGIAAATLTLAVPETVNPDLTVAALLEALEGVPDPAAPSS